MAALIYKQFDPARTVFFLLFLAFFACFAGVVRAQTNEIYTIEGVTVDVVDKNAVAAREKALMEAQVKAYGILAERLLGEAAKTTPVPSADNISMLVQDFEVTNEQLSKVRYKGTYTIRFRPNALKSQMASQGKTYNPDRKPVLVLPFYQSASREVLWSEPNPFMTAWRRIAADKSAFQTTVLPLGDASDVTLIGDNEAMDYDPMQVQQLAQRYNANEAAILVAMPEIGGSGQRKLTVAIYSHGFEGPQLVQKISFDQLPNETDDLLFGRAVAKIKTVLVEGWKNNAAYSPATSQQPPVKQPTIAPPVGINGQPPVAYTKQALGPASTYNTYARFASVQDWVRMKNTLDRVYGVQSVLVKALKPREAMIDIRYAGNINQLQAALQNAGIMMRATSANGPIEIFLNATQQQPLYYR